MLVEYASYRLINNCWDLLEVS